MQTTRKMLNTIKEKWLKQLIERSGLYYFNWKTKETNITTENFKYPRLENYQKFSELIVQDVLNTMYGEIQYQFSFDLAEEITRSVAKLYDTEFVKQD